MECREVIEMIDRYYEKQLNDIEVHKIEKHLEECDECRNEYEEMKVIFNLLLDHPIVLPPEDFTNNIMDKVGHKKDYRRTKTIMMKKWGISFVAAGLLIFVLNTSQGYSIDDMSKYIYRDSFTRNSGVAKYIKEIHSIFTNKYERVNIGGLKFFKGIRFNKE
ncbi:zf-HC2 domain-containing protein [Wukongibacter baidiensis]|uniref:anti-sigma factor family protein n=1 Tax=Wukongibacter baidiensis TaxID=1723361 RepID=UPI003D7F3F0B